MQSHDQASHAHRGYGLLGWALLLVLALGLLALTDASPALGLLALVGLAVLLPLGVASSASHYFLFLFVLTSSIEISQALVVEGAVYAAPLSLMVSDLFLMALTLTWGIDRLRGREAPMRWEWPHWLALLYLLDCALSAATSLWPLPGWMYCLTQARYVFAFILLSNVVNTPGRLRLCLQAMLWAVALQVAVAGLSVLLGGDLPVPGLKGVDPAQARLTLEGSESASFRPSGLLPHPNMLGSFMVLSLPITGALLLLKGQTVAPAWRLWLLLLGGGTAIVLTLSRGAWAGLVVATMALVWGAYKLGVLTPRGLRRMLQAGAVGGLAVALLVPSIWMRLFGQDNRSVESRLLLLDQAVLMVKEHAIWGVGVGAYTRASQHILPPSFAKVSIYFQRSLRHNLVHNRYLLTIVEQGLVGLATFLLPIVVVLARLWRHPWQRREFHLLGLALGCSIAGQLVCYTSDHFHFGAISLMLWLHLALILAIQRIDTRFAAVTQPQTPGVTPPSVAAWRHSSP